MTKPLEGLLGITSEAIVSGEEERKIGFDLSPISHGGPFVEFSCGGVSMTVRGSVIVPVTADKMALSSKQTYKATGGNQVPEHFEGEPNDVLETSAGGGPFEHAGLTMKLTQTSEEPVEVNAFT